MSIRLQSNGISSETLVYLKLKPMQAVQHSNDVRATCIIQLSTIKVKLSGTGAGREDKFAEAIVVCADMAMLAKMQDEAPEDKEVQ